MKKLFLFLLFVFVSYLAIAQDMYLITLNEIESIEKLCQKSEQEKQNLLLQVKTLKSQSMELSEQVKTLKSQLENQRTLNLKLEQSFNELEVEKSQIIMNVQKQNDDLQNKNYKLKNSIIIFISISIIEFLILMLILYLRIRHRHLGI